MQPITCHGFFPKLGFTLVVLGVGIFSIIGDAGADADAGAGVLADKGDSAIPFLVASYWYTSPQQRSSLLFLRLPFCIYTQSVLIICTLL